jgi:hypothetical protein
MRKSIATETGPGPRNEIKTCFGHILHSKVDIACNMMREIEATTAKLHGSQDDLSVRGSVT